MMIIVMTTTRKTIKAMKTTMSKMKTTKTTTTRQRHQRLPEKKTATTTRINEGFFMVSMLLTEHFKRLG